MALHAQLLKPQDAAQVLTPLQSCISLCTNLLDTQLSLEGLRISCIDCLGWHVDQRSAMLIFAGGRRC